MADKAKYSFFDHPDTHKHYIAPGRFKFETHGKQAFGIAGGHAQQTGKHAPEHGTGATTGQSHSHAHNVTRADIGRQRDRQGCIMGNAVALRLAAQRTGNAAEQIPLRHTQHHSKIQVHPQQGKDKNIAPQAVAYG